MIPILTLKLTYMKSFFNKNKNQSIQSLEFFNFLKKELFTLKSNYKYVKRPKPLILGLLKVFETFYLWEFEKISPYLQALTDQVFWDRSSIFYRETMQNFVSDELLEEIEQEEREINEIDETELKNRITKETINIIKLMIDESDKIDGFDWLTKIINQQYSQKCKNHLFYEIHILDRYKSSGEPVETKRFDANEEQARAWKRLEEETHTQDDLTWLKHEKAEQ